VTRSPPVRRRSLLILVAGAVAVSWLLVGFLEVLVRLLATGDARFLDEVIVAAACVATVPIVAVQQRRADGGSAIRPASFVLLAWFPCSFALATLQLATPVQMESRVEFPTTFGDETSWSSWKDAPTSGFVRRWGLRLGVPGSASIPGVFVAAMVLAMAADRRRSRRAPQIAACTAVAVSVLVLAASLRRIHKLELEDYLASLRVAGMLSGDGVPFEGPGFSVTRVTGDAMFSAVTRRWRESGRRRLFVIDDPFVWGGPGRRDSEFDPLYQCSKWGMPQGVRAHQCQPEGPVLVLRDAVTLSPNCYAVDDSLETAEISPRAMGSSLRPPTPWAVSNAVGTLLALALLFRAASIRRRADRWQAGRPGEHRGQGWVSFEDGTPPAHIATAATLPVGAVVVLERERVSQHYREHGRMRRDADRCGDARRFAPDRRGARLGPLRLREPRRAGHHGPDAGRGYRRAARVVRLEASDATKQGAPRSA
jgi:hypothetical protein